MDRAAVPSAANRRRRTPRPSMKWQKTRSPFAFSSPRPLRLTLYSRRGANSDGDRFATPRRKMGVTAVWALASRTVRKWEDSGELIPKWAQRRRRALLRHGQNPRATEVSPRRQKHRLELVSCIDSIRAPTRPSRIGIGRSAFADGSGPGQNRAFKDAVALMGCPDRRNTDFAMSRPIVVTVCVGWLRNRLPSTRLRVKKVLANSEPYPV